VDGIDLVIHADSPVEHKVYLHRSGRTARAGATGTVITLQTPVQADAVRDLMRKAGVVPLTAAVHPGSALLHSIAGESAPLVELTADRAEVIAAAPASGRAAAALSAGFRGRRGR
jgi:superfamily II DNA/RNA helicase